MISTVLRQTIFQQLKHSCAERMKSVCGLLATNLISQEFEIELPKLRYARIVNTRTVGKKTLFFLVWALNLQLPGDRIGKG